MRRLYLAPLAILASLSWIGPARAENLGSKITDAVSAAATTESEAASQGQSVNSAPADATEREALTAEARDTASQAQKGSQGEQK
jgi:hypothetical protein